MAKRARKAAVMAARGSGSSSLVIYQDPGVSSPSFGWPGGVAALACSCDPPLTEGLPFRTGGAPGDK